MEDGNKFIILMATYFKCEELCNCLNVLKQASGNEEFSQLRVYDNHSDEPVVAALRYHIIVIKGMSVTFGEENIGKAAAINALAYGVEEEEPIRPNDIICIMDADIMVERETLIHLKEFIEHFPGSIVVPEHIGFRVHTYKERDIYGFVEPVGSAKTAGRVGTLCVRDGRGVAGACMTMQAQTFFDCGGFDVNSIYGGNEAGLWKRYFEGPGKDAEGVFILADSKVFHPEEKDIGYQEYKNECQKEIRNKGETNKKGYYDAKHTSEQTKDGC